MIMDTMLLDMEALWIASYCSNCRVMNVALEIYIFELWNMFANSEFKLRFQLWSAMLRMMQRHSLGHAWLTDLSILLLLFEMLHLLYVMG
jgi:hypothetical protein